MKRRRPEPDSPAASEVPEHLAVCHVEDWLEPGEQGDPMVVAWRRWKQARRDWAQQTGFDGTWPPMSRPRRRNPPTHQQGDRK